MLQVIFNPTTREALLEASPDAFARLATACRQGETVVACDSPTLADENLSLGARYSDTTIELSLTVVAVKPTADPLSAVALRVMSPGLVIRGGIEGLELLARDFDQLTKADPGERLVAAWFPGHAYLAATSVPTTLAVADADASRTEPG